MAVPHITQDDLEHWFTFHTHTGTPEQFRAIRAAAKDFAAIILANTPPCPDQSVAIRKVREAVMTANAAIALDGR